MHKGKYLKRYTKDMIAIMQNMHPDWDEDILKEEIYKIIDKRCQNPFAEIDNNYTGEHKETTLLSVLDWEMERHPIIAGNGTFYKNQEEAINPIAKMLEGFLTQRKAYKKQMFLIEDTQSPQYKDLDLAQQNEKVLANSYYGASGMPSSAFYSTWSGPATTLTAQSVISTAEQMFEGMIGDNYIYLNLTELLEFMEEILKDFYFDEFDEFITPHDIDDVLDRYLMKIWMHQESDRELLELYLQNKTEEELCVLYYSNNIFEFIRDHDEIQDIILSIFENVENMEYVDKNDPDWMKHVPKDYREQFVGKDASKWNDFVNKEYFMDPNNPPTSITDQLIALKDYMCRYVYSRYLSFDRVYRLKNFQRQTVTVIDTDSNILSLDTLVHQIQDEIICDNTFGRDYEHNVFITVNMIAYVLSAAVENVLLYYGEQANIPEEYRPIFAMKNEFFFSRLVIGETKKRYISRIVLREGNLMNPPKSDIKGFDFKKSTTSEFAEKFFMKLIKKHILESDKIDLRPILKDVYEFRDSVKASIDSGEVQYLPNASAKVYEAYSNPSQIASLKGVLAWNYLVPEQQIELPARVSLLKLNIFELDDVKDLQKTNPKIYQIIEDKIFNDTTGMFVKVTYEKDLVEPVHTRMKDWTSLIPKKYRAKYKKLGMKAWNEFAENYDYDAEQVEGHYEYKRSGLQNIAIPQNGKIPDWIKPYIDYDTVLDNIMAPFVPILEAFGMKTLENGKMINGTNRKTNAVSNIVKF